MNQTNQLLHRIADPTLTHHERARLRCQLAKELEETGNYEAAREAMGELWSRVGERPVLDALDDAVAAEVLLRAGTLTGWIGSAKQIEGAQETAKDLITESIRKFERLQDDKKIAEAQTELGYCYWREGAFDEARVVLREALTRLSDADGGLKAVALLRSAAIEKVTFRLSDALRLLMEAAPLFEKSGNDTIKGRFHNEYGTVLKNLGAAEHRADYIDRALIEYAAASHHFEQAGHRRYQACVENNLGMLFCTASKFAEAHEHLDRAQALFTGMKDGVHTAQVDETRARVLLAEGRVAEAEKLVRAAVRILDKGGEQSLLAEALTTHGVALARSGQHKHARLALQRAVEVAYNAGDNEGAGQAALAVIEELGEQLTADDLSATYERAADLLSTSKHPASKDRLLACAHRVLYLVGVLPTPAAWTGFSFKETVRRFEARLVARALKDAGGIVSRAARLLGVTRQSLSAMLENRHQDLLPLRMPVEPRKSSLMFIHDECCTERQTVTILHAEDDQHVADAVKDALEAEGWKVETQKHGALALEQIAGDAHYDALIFDYTLPGLNGVELVRQTRALAHRQQTPIIMLTASDVEKEARRAGANAFLSKPVDIAAITETVARLLARRSRQH
jgi:CheY-like chemotaxis protein/tetratricopeptide (TPR) repeat protein